MFSFSLMVSSISEHITQEMVGRNCQTSQLLLIHKIIRRSPQNREEQILKLMYATVCIEKKLLKKKGKKKVALL